MWLGLERHLAAVFLIARADAVLVGGAHELDELLEAGAILVGFRVPIFEDHATAGATDAIFVTGPAFLFRLGRFEHMGAETG